MTADPSTDGAIDLSVVIPTVGRWSSIDRLLAALDRQSLARDRFEVIVVVNGARSADPVPAGRADHDVRLIRRERRGRGGAIDTGVVDAGGSVIVFLDDDMEPDPGCLAGHLAAHEDGAPRLVLGPVPVAGRDGRSVAGRYVHDRFERHLAKLAATPWAVGVGDVYTGNASIDAATLRAVGGFGERFEAYGNEDRDLARRLVRAGVPIVYRPEASAVQHYEKDLDGLLADSRAKGRTAVALAAIDPSAGAQTPLRRPGSGRRRMVRGLIQTAGRRPSGRLATRRLTAAIATVAPRTTLSLVGHLVDAEFWDGVAAARHGQAARSGPLPSEPATAAAVGRRRRVLHMTDSVDFGGAERVLLQAVAGLDPGMWSSWVRYPASADRLADRLRDLPAVGVPLEMARGGRSARLRWAVTAARTIRRLRPDVVHVHRPWPRSSRLLLTAAILARPRSVVVTDHLAARSTSWRGRWLEWVLDHGIDRHIAVSDAVAAGLADVLAVPWDRIRVVPNGVEIGPAPDPRRPRGDRVPVIVMVAQLRPQKGHDILLDALTQLSVDVRVRLIGDGAEGPVIRDRVDALGLAGRVEMVGFTDDVRSQLVAADVVVLPSRFEGLPIALLEAMAAGCTVIASDIPGHAEVVRDGIDGLLVPPDDPTALATAMAAILHDEPAAARLGAAARVRVAERFDVRDMVAAVAKVYGETLARTSIARATGSSGAAETGTASTAEGTEVQRDAALRRIDARLATRWPVPRRAAVLGRPDGRVRRGLKEITGSVTDLHGEHALSSLTAPVDLVVAVDPSGPDLATAAAAVGADGDILLLIDGRVPSDMGPRLTSRGLVPVQVLRAWPSRGRAAAWIPARSAGALPAVRAARGGRNRARRLAGRLEAIAWRVAGTWGSSTTAIIARRTDATDVSRGPGSTMATWAGLDWTLLTGGRRSRNRIVALGIPHAGSSPTEVVIAARVPVSVEGLRREAAALEHAAARVPPVPGVPALIRFHDAGAATLVVERAVPGAPLSAALRPGAAAAVAGSVADWLAGLVRPGEAHDRAAVQAEAATRIEALESRYGAVLDRAVTETLRTVFRDSGPIPVALEHGDAAPWNLRRTPSGEIWALDWESARVDGMAGKDLAYAMAYLAFDVAGATSTDGQLSVYRATLRPGSAPASTRAAATSRYATATGLSPDDLARMAMLAWLGHAQVEYDRAVEDAGRAPDARILAGSLFLGLLRIDLAEWSERH